MQTPHQILGILVTSMIFALFLLGIVLAVIKRRGATKSPHVAADGTVLPPKAVGGGIPVKIHQWGQRLVWVLMLITGGL